MSETLEKPAPKAALSIVGSRPVRPDGADKVTGRAAYGADFNMPGQLVGRVLRSPHAHARIVSIDASKARALPGVKAVITAADFPDLASEELEGGEAAANLRDLSLNVMARGKALYHGHAVAAVAAVSTEIAEAALERIKVTYEVLPHVIDVEAAMSPDAPVLHDHLFTEGLEARPDRPSNIAKKHRFARGDLAEGFAAADVVVEGRYTTKATHQGYIEPHACVAAWGEDGRCDVWSSSQGHFMVRTFCARLLGLDISDVRVTPAEIGGGFGGKTTVYLEPLALALSRASGRPVKMVMSREEVFRATGPTSGGIVRVRLGAKSDGTIVAADVELTYQAGAFPGSPVGAGAMTALACYDIPNFSIVGWDVVTNTPKVAAYRAPGAPISAFGVESAVDELALKLGMDPIALREKNAVKDGTKASYGPTFQNIGYLDTLAAIRESEHWKTPLGPNQGRGVAVGFWFNVGGESTAAVHIGEDGSAAVVTGNPDIGGSRASMAMMAAETLGLPIDKVRPMIADTSSIGYSMLTGGSRVTFATGMAVVQAAEKVTGELCARAAKLWDVPRDQVAWEGGKAVCLDAAKDRAPLSLEALAAQSARTGGPISGQATINAQGAGPGFGVHLCDVEVDPETGQVSVVRYTAAQDVGKAIHPSYVEGQVQGGVAQGVGWALNEEYIFDGEGRMENAGFLDYRMPVASDLPMLDAILVETAPNPRHPFGAKGVGEVPIVPPLAAVANAVRGAIGVRMPDLPISPPKVLAALDAKGG
ncbi:MAG: xanthine dehydrogenase family protein molybdopterin-binding subunit [Phenylobacterium sp.]|uniref:xanthine dehydrogenase family protein molybdopterin-binding subunit n=1 Tax=Phenylobacterium sp. TaxID=1871053 RepID=UPI001A5A3666|nr:xanthine dehydrogenase family protein molybdopterin-binding subunit [Phenylobacterium sp.]MBL8770526.1 xanthine dehydrogenase family protein molybdopterin-binding subunit [Phenylobacterium sp.]